MSLKTPIAGLLVSAALLMLASCGNAVEHTDGAGQAAAATETANNLDAAKNAGVPLAPESASDGGESVELVGPGVPDKVALAILGVLADDMRIPKTAVTSINKSPIPDLYEVVIQKFQVFYVTGDGRYIMDSHIVDIKNKVDLTDQRLSQITKVDVSTLPLKNAIVTTLGDGSRDLYVFADPDCPFCKRLQRTLLKMNNIKIHTFLMGLTALHPQALEHAERIMCQKDPSKVWNEWTLSNEHDVDKVIPKAPKCQTGVLENQRFADNIEVSGTPMVIFPNGIRVSGAMSEERIEKMLAEALKK